MKLLPSPHATASCATSSSVSPGNFYSGSVGDRGKRGRPTLGKGPGLPFGRKRVSCPGMSKNVGKIIAIEDGENRPPSLSSAGSRAMNVVPTYIRSLTNLLQSTLKRAQQPQGLDSQLAERITQIQQTQEEILKRVSRVESLLSSQQSHSTASASRPPQSDVPRGLIQASITESTGTPIQPERGNSNPASGIDSIHPYCKVLQVKPVACLVPPFPLKRLTRKQLDQIRTQSTSFKNFAANLIKLAYPPADRIKYSCTGISKGPIKHCKKGYPSHILQTILDLTKSEYPSFRASPQKYTKALYETIDSESRALLHKAQHCKKNRLCLVCRGEEYTLTPLSYIRREGLPSSCESEDRPNERNRIEGSNMASPGISTSIGNPLPCRNPKQVPSTMNPQSNNDLPAPLPGVHQLFTSEPQTAPWSRGSTSTSAYAADPSRVHYIHCSTKRALHF